MVANGNYEFMAGYGCSWRRRSRQRSPCSQSPLSKMHSAIKFSIDKTFSPREGGICGQCSRRFQRKVLGRGSVHSERLRDPTAHGATALVISTSTYQSGIPSAHLSWEFALQRHRQCERMSATNLNCTQRIPRHTGILTSRVRLREQANSCIIKVPQTSPRRDSPGSHAPSKIVEGLPPAALHSSSSAAWQSGKDCPVHC